MLTPRLQRESVWEKAFVCCCSIRGSTAERSAGVRGMAELRETTHMLLPTYHPLACYEALARVRPLVLRGGSVFHLQRVSGRRRGQIK